VAEPTRRLVPRDPEALGHVATIAELQGWELVEPAAGDDWHAGWQAEPGTFVKWYADDEAGVDYITVEGPARERIEETIRSGIELLTPATFAAAFEMQRAPMARGHVLLAIAAVVRPGFDESALSALDAGLHDENPHVRRYAIFASELVDWPQLWATIEDLRTDDPEPAVRRSAEQVLARRTPGADGREHVEPPG
jgi:hypothetical protein